MTGVFRTRWNVPTFITTLALMTALTGASNLLTRGFPLTPYPDAFNFLGGGYIGVVPFPAILFVLVFLVFHLVANFTVFGRAVYAIGGNAEAARLSGIPVARVKCMVIGIASLCSFLAGILVSSQIMSGTPTAARGWELDVISAVIIGGVSMQGGSGSIAKTFIGIVFLGIIVNGMTLLNVNEYWQYVVKGGLILGAVLLNQIQLGRERR
jgi:ribose/xylose/arabinose/galactoside ABC-type transport system permease subunit